MAMLTIHLPGKNRVPGAIPAGPIWVLAAAVFMAGCAGGWKPSVPKIPSRDWQPLVYGDKYKSIHIPVLKNETFQYGLEENLTAALIEHFMNDGRLRITRRKNADLILEGAITHVEQIPLAYDDEDRAVGYDLLIHVTMRLVEPYDTSDPDAEPVVVQPPREFEVRGPSMLTQEPAQSRTRDLSLALADQIFSKFFEGW